MPRQYTSPLNALMEQLPGTAMQIYQSSVQAKQRAEDREFQVAESALDRMFRSKEAQKTRDVQTAQFKETHDLATRTEERVAANQERIRELDEERQRLEETKWESGEEQRQANLYKTELENKSLELAREILEIRGKLVKDKDFPEGFEGKIKPEDIYTEDRGTLAGFGKEGFQKTAGREIVNMLPQLMLGPAGAPISTYRAAQQLIPGADKLPSLDLLKFKKVNTKPFLDLLGQKEDIMSARVAGLGDFSDAAIGMIGPQLEKDFSGLYGRYVRNILGDMKTKDQNKVIQELQKNVALESVLSNMLNMGGGIEATP